MLKPPTLRGTEITADTYMICSKGCGSSSRFPAIFHHVRRVGVKDQQRCITHDPKDPA
jgi:hypothetical protein